LKIVAGSRHERRGCNRVFSGLTAKRPHHRHGGQARWWGQRERGQFSHALEGQIRSSSLATSELRPAVSSRLALAHQQAPFLTYSRPSGALKTILAQPSDDTIAAADGRGRRCQTDQTPTIGASEHDRLARSRSRDAMWKAGELCYTLPRTTISSPVRRRPFASRRDRSSFSVPPTRKVRNSAPPSAGLFSNHSRARVESDRYERRIDWRQSPNC
jgi:hypothetical protein